MSRRLVFLTVLLTGCGGNAPMVQSPDQALAPNMSAPPCSANQPPPGYAGPRSPYHLPCGEHSIRSLPPVGVHDYGQGMPPRTVSGQ